MEGPAGFTSKLRQIKLLFFCARFHDRGCNGSAEERPMRGGFLIVAVVAVVMIVAGAGATVPMACARAYRAPGPSKGLSKPTSPHGFCTRAFPAEAKARANPLGE